MKLLSVVLFYLSQVRSFHFLAATEVLTVYVERWLGNFTSGCGSTQQPHEHGARRTFTLHDSRNLMLSVTTMFNKNRAITFLSRPI